MKKKFKCLFAIILSLIVVDNARAADYLPNISDCNNGRAICYYGSSTGVTSYWTQAKTGTAWQDTVKAYRVTFFTAGGSKVGKSVDYYAVDASDANYYYGKSKIEYKNSSFRFKSAESPDVDKSLILGNSNLSVYNSQTAETWKQKLTDGVTAEKWNDFIEQLAKNTGKYDDVKKNFLDGNLYVSIEPIFQISVQESTFKSQWTSIFATDLIKNKCIKNSRPKDINKFYSSYDPSKAKDCDNYWYCRLEAETSGTSYDNCDKVLNSVLDGSNIVTYRGTGTEMALILNYYNDNNEKFGLSKYGMLDYFNQGNLGFIRCTGCDVYFKFTTAMSLDSSDVMELNKNFSSSSNPLHRTFYDVNSYNKNNVWYNLANSSSNLGLNIFKVSPGGKTECTRDNYKSLGRDYNFHEDKCCPVGQEYNRDTKKCEEPEDEDDNNPGSPVWLYQYECYSTLNVCTNDEKVDHELYSLSEGLYKKDYLDGTSEYFTSSAGCVLYNSRYATNRSDIYCYETLVTDLQSLVTDLKSVTSGMFIPIAKKGNPSVTVSGTCYANGNTKSMQNLMSYVFVKYSKLDTKISLNYFNDNSAIFEAEDGKVNIKGSGSSTTEYQLPYYYLSFEAVYNYIPSSKKDPYVDKFTAQGTDSLKPNKSNTNLSEVNFKTPVLKATGLYKDAIKVSLLKPVTNDGLFDNLLRNLGQGYAELTNGNSCPGQCTVQIDRDTEDEATNDKDAFIEAHEKEYAFEVEGPTSHCVDWEGCWQEYTWTDYEWDENNNLVPVEKTGEYWDSHCSCRDHDYYYNIKFKTEHSSACSATGGSFKPDNPNGCYVELKFDNEFHGSKPSNYDCTADTEVTNQLTTCSQDSPTYNPQTGTCDKQPFDKLVFRPIDLSNPFPGYEGIGRVPGSNWTQSDIDEYITNRQDVYTKKPLYTITLTPTIIKEIRKYNKDHDYDDFNLECQDGNSRACYSSFIRKYLDVNKSRCSNTANQTASAFDACAIYQ